MTPIKKRTPFLHEKQTPPNTKTSRVANGVRSLYSHIGIKNRLISQTECPAITSKNEVKSVSIPSFSGLTAAKKAGAGKIMAIDPLGKNRALFEEKQLADDGILTDFTSFFEVIAGHSV